MLDLLCKLHKEGALQDNGLFSKTAGMILRAEMEKVALIGPQPLEDIARRLVDQSDLLGGDLSDALSTIRGAQAPAGSAQFGALEDLITGLRVRTANQQAVLGLESELRKLLLSSGMGADDVRLAVGKAGGVAGNLRRDIASLKQKVKLPLLSRLSSAISSRPNLQKGLGIAALLAAVGATGKAFDTYKKMKTERESNKAFADVLARNPEFEIAKATEIFKTMQNVAPHLSTDPAAIEGFVQPHMSWDTLPYTAIKDLAQTQKFIEEGRDYSGDGLFSDAFKDLGEAFGSILALGN